MYSKCFVLRYLTGQDIQWKSENPEIATVDFKGNITGSEQGGVSVWAIIDGYKYVFKIIIE